MRLLSSALLACALTLGMVSAQLAAAATAAGGDEKVTLTGCLVKGKNGGFLLTQVAGTQVSSVTTASPVVTPGATMTTTTTTTTTTTAVPSQVLYWLDDDDKLEGFSGRTVEVMGELEGDVKKGELQVERKDDGMIELEAKFGGRKVTALLPEVPAAVATSGGVGRMDREIDYLVRKVDVKSVRMLADNCR